MPLIKGPGKIAPAAPEAAPSEPKSFALAHSMKVRRHGPTVASADEEAPPASIAEAILRKRRAAAPPVDGLSELDAFAEEEELANEPALELEEEEPHIPAPRDRIDAIMRRKRATERG